MPMFVPSQNYEVNGGYEKKKLPKWWLAGKFMREEDWESEFVPKTAYLWVVIEATERGHDGYCSEIDEYDGVFHNRYCESSEITETKFKLIGTLPLGDWDFSEESFDPGWECPQGSSVCGVRPSVRFVSAKQMEV